MSDPGGASLDVEHPSFGLSMTTSKAKGRPYRFRHAGSAQSWWSFDRSSSALNLPATAFSSATGLMESPLTPLARKVQPRPTGRELNDCRYKLPRCLVKGHRFGKPKASSYDECSLHLGRSDPLSSLAPPDSIVGYPPPSPKPVGSARLQTSFHHPKDGQACTAPTSLRLIGSDDGPDASRRPLQPVQPQSTITNRLILDAHHRMAHPACARLGVSSERGWGPFRRCGTAFQVAFSRAAVSILANQAQRFRANTSRTHQGWRSARFLWPTLRIAYPRVDGGTFPQLKLVRTPLVTGSPQERMGSLSPPSSNESIDA